MSDEIKAVEFVAEIRQVKTMADHTVNVTLNLPEYCRGQAAWFMQHQGDMVRSVSEVLLNKENGTSKGTDKQSRWQTSEGESAGRASIGGAQ